jgi:hypothetical protein
MKNKTRIDRMKENWEIRQIRFQMLFDVIKSCAYVFVSLFVFLYITNPEWTLQKASVEDEIKRERAKLTIDLMQLKKYEDIIIGLDVLKAAYGEKDTAWIAPIEIRYREIIYSRIDEYTKKDAGRDSTRLKNVAEITKTLKQ